MWLAQVGRERIEETIDPEQTIAVRFSGEAPPLFKPGAEIIAGGLYDPNRRSLNAEELITKCPGKYEKQHRKDNL